MSHSEPEKRRRLKSEQKKHLSTEKSPTAEPVRKPKKSSKKAQRAKPSPKANPLRLPPDSELVTSRKLEDYTVHLDEGIDFYMREIGNIPVLSVEQEMEVARRAAKGDKEAKELLIVSNLRLVVKIAREFRRNGLSMQDLIGEGNLGLFKTVERFDNSSGCRFSTYAGYWIRQSIRIALNHGAMIRIPAYLAEVLSKWRRAEKYLQAELERKPSMEEICRRIGMSKSKIHKISQALGVSYWVPRGESMENVGSELQGYTNPNERTPDDAYMDQEMLVRVREEIDRLTERDATVLKMRFGLDGYEKHTLREVGDKLVLTRERVRQIALNVVSSIRASLGIQQDELPNKEEEL